MYHHKSGAQKRKEKKEKTDTLEKGKRTLESLGFTVQSQPKKLQISIDNHAENNISVDDSVAISNENGEQIYSNVSEAMNNSEISSDSETSISQSNFDQMNGIENVSTADLVNLDIGNYKTSDLCDFMKKGPQPIPQQMPLDKDGNKFPLGLVNMRLNNNENVKRDWLTWSHTKQALYCFPCRIFCKLPDSHRSFLTIPNGWEPTKSKYKKLYSKIPEHENYQNHKNCYIEWKQLEKNSSVVMDNLLVKEHLSEVQKWKELLTRFLDVTLFLSERGLAFFGDNSLVGSESNGNFLGILELMSHYDSILDGHLRKVKEAQEKKIRLQVHYLSPQIQNEFISCCAEQVMALMLEERDIAKYFSIIVDATPDSSHMEQTTFILRYVGLNKVTNKYEVVERFLKFVDCNKKTGEDISTLILETLADKGIPISDCRGQGYDNGSNMSGKYRGVQARILNVNPLAVFSPCACHSLNLCGVHAAECCPESITFFGVLQKLWNIFSGSPSRWEIIKKNIGVSLHSMSTTRWSARIECVKPFAHNHRGLLESIDEILTSNLTAEVRADLMGIKKYMAAYESVIMGNLWFKILTAVNNVSVVLQARNSTIDVEVKNLMALVEKLKSTLNSWDTLLDESREYAKKNDIQVVFKEKRKVRRPMRYLDDPDTENEIETPEEKFKVNVFQKIINSVLENINDRFCAASAINTKFEILWKFREMDENTIKLKAFDLIKDYGNDVNENLLDEIIHLKDIFDANFGDESSQPVNLLQEIHNLKLQTIFPNFVIMLRIFLTIPVTVAEAERSFSTLSRIKNVLRSTMLQERLSNLGLLAIESRLAKSCDFSKIIDIFSNRKARKAPLI